MSEPAVFQSTPPANDAVDAPQTDASTDAVSPKSNTIACEEEVGGRKGPDPTRYGDWEKNGRCIDF